MNICKSEEHNMLVRAALIYRSANPGLTYAVLKDNNLLLPNGQMNRRMLIDIVKSNPHKLRNLPGVGEGTYFDIIRMLLETV
jgi:hypothetical protein